MKFLLSFLLAIPTVTAIAQCPFPASIKSSGTTCLGATLEAGSGNQASQIVWKKDGAEVDRQQATTTYNPTGITVAGGNYSGGGANQINSASGISVDQAGNIYVVDFYNNRVMKWAPGATAGVLVAGGNGKGSAPNQFDNPDGIWVMANGDIYVADLENNRIQKWPAGATQGTTVAGGNGKGDGANQLNWPVSIFIDDAGNIFISDFNNDRVQKWAPGATSGITVAGGNGFGNGPGQLSNTGDIFVDKTGNLYVCDPTNSRIQMWAPGATQGLTVAAGMNPAPVGYPFFPSGIWMDGSGNLIVSDQTNGWILRWKPGASSGTRIAGSNFPNDSPEGLENPGRLRLDAQGNLFVCDELNYRVQKFIPQTSIKKTYLPVIGGTYTATITDPSGCVVVSNSILISPSITPTITVTSSQNEVCQGTRVEFTAAPGPGIINPVYQWQVNNLDVPGSGSTFTSNTLANLDIVTCLLSTSQVCSTAPTALSVPITMSVQAGTSPVLTISASSQAFCSGTAVTLNAIVSPLQPESVYSWLINDNPVVGSGPDLITSGIADGDIVKCRISGTDGSACSTAISNDLDFAVSHSPIVADTSLEISPGESIVLNPAISADAIYFDWSPATWLSASNVIQPLATPAKNITYQLTATNSNGCKGSGKITIHIFSAIRVPNVFTPNHDGKNDVFYLLGGCRNCLIKKFEIFNRWGQRVFQTHDAISNDPTYGWDGQLSSGPASPGNYVYQISFLNEDGRIELIKGSVLLIR